MATPLKSYPFCNGVLASGKMCDYEKFLIAVLFVKNKRDVSEKVCVFIPSNFFKFLPKIYYGFVKIDLQLLTKYLRQTLVFM